MGGVPGVAPADVVVIGGGMAGYNAAARRQGYGRARHRVRPQRRPPCARSTPNSAAASRPGYSSALDLEDARQARRPGDRRRPGPRREGTQAGDEFDCRAHEVGRGAGGHRDRPGRLLRGLAAHHPRRPDVRGARHGVLLRGQHAGCGAADVDLRADQRHHAVRAQARRQGLAGGRAKPMRRWPRACRRTRARCVNEQVAADLDLPFTAPASVL